MPNWVVVACVVVERIIVKSVMVEVAAFTRMPPESVARFVTASVLERVAAPEAERVVRLVGPKVAAMLVASSLPPERVRPWDETSPAAEMPPAAVEVPVPVMSICVINALPAETTRP